MIRDGKTKDNVETKLKADYPFAGFVTAAVSDLTNHTTTIRRMANMAAPYLNSTLHCTNRPQIKNLTN